MISRKNLAGSATLVALMLAAAPALATRGSGDSGWIAAVAGGLLFLHATGGYLPGGVKVPVLVGAVGGAWLGHRYRLRVRDRADTK